MTSLTVHRILFRGDMTILSGETEKHEITVDQWKDLIAKYGGQSLPFDINTETLECYPANIEGAPTDD